MSFSTISDMSGRSKSGYWWLARTIFTLKVIFHAKKFSSRCAAALKMTELDKVIELVSFLVTRVRKGFTNGLEMLGFEWDGRLVDRKIQRMESTNKAESRYCVSRGREMRFQRRN
jgi:hypothetical protein